jgi:hypothetical protein
MWLQHQSKRQLRLEKADGKRNVTLFVSWQNKVYWLRHAEAKPREGADYSAARQDTRSDRDCLEIRDKVKHKPGGAPGPPANGQLYCRFNQKEESSMIGRDLFNTPCRICRRPTSP